MSSFLEIVCRFPSIRVARGRNPFAAVLGLVLAFVICGAPGAEAWGESSKFTRPTAETFTGKQALVDAFRGLEVEYRNSRDTLELLGIGQNAIVTYWQWSAMDDTAPPSIEFHLESGEYLVIDIASGALLTYVRYGAYFVSPGRPEESAPETPKPKSAALSEEKANAIAVDWLRKFAKDATWTAAGPVYKDRFDVETGDLYGAWWDYTFERTHGGYTVRGADAEMSLNAETGALMRFAMPIFTPPMDLAIYFPIENARIKANDYLNLASNTLFDLLVVKPSLPELQSQDTGDSFSVRGGLGRRAQKKALKKEVKQQKANNAALGGGEDGGKGNGDDDGLAVPMLAPIPPTLGPGEVVLVLAPVSECWKQETWQPIDATKPGVARYTLVYEFPTQTPTALTLPVLITTTGNEVVR